MSICLPWLAAGVLAAGLPAELRDELVPVTLPAAAYRLLDAWECEAPEGHQTGRRVDDPTASGDAAWAVEPGLDRSDRCPQYGPYRELAAGNYLAVFRLRLTAPADDDLVARLDAVVDLGRQTLGTANVYTGDLSPERWRSVALPFAYRGGKLECRVHWTGVAGLRFDRIQLFAVGGEVDFRPALAPQPVSTGQPRELPYPGGPPAFAALFPRAGQPAGRLTVLDLRRQSDDLRAALLTLQGLVNRDTPTVYALTCDQDEFWLDWLLRRGYATELERLADPLELLARHRELIKGVIITDPRLPASRNIAYLLASLNSALPVSPRLARQLGQPVLEDLRGRWRTNAEAYRQTFETLWPRCSRQAIACLWPDDSTGLRDYLVQHNIFCFWLGGRIDGAQPGGSSQADLETMESLFARLPANIPVLGYPWHGVDVGIGEHDGVQSFARYAKYLVGTSGVTNLSVLSGYPLPELRQQRPPAPALEEGQVYLTWVMSDGDNLPVLSRGNFPQLWADEHRGQTPLAWSLSPAAAALMPPIVEYYYRTAKPTDAFVAAVSGIGYTYPQDYAERYEPAARERLFDDFLTLTEAGLRAHDLQQIWLMGVDPGPLLRRYAERLPSLTGLFPDYGRRQTRYDQAFYASARGVPVCHAATDWVEEASREEKIERAVDQLRQMAPAEGTGFLQAFIWNWGADLSIYPEVMRRLGPRFIAVRPDHLVELARRWLDARSVLLRLPPRLMALEGRPASCQVRLDNTTGRELTWTAAVTEGLTAAGVTPASGRLPAHEGVDLTVGGTAAGATVKLAVSGAFGRTEATLPLTMIPRSELLAESPAGGLAFVDRFDAVPLAHRSGEARDDATALAGRVWVATAGRAEAGHIVYGPYRPTPAGRYLALFRLRRLGPGEGPVAIVDAHVGGGPDLGRREVTAAELPEGAWRCAPLTFDHPGGALETRVFWPGRADLAVDGVLLFRWLD